MLTGTIVNALLFIAVTKLPKQRLLPVIVLPNIGALLHGVLFGPLTVFLFYFLPFIWVGNTILVFTFLILQNKGLKGVGVITAAILKSVFLFGLANIYFHFKVVPKLFITSMGLIQFVTALLGGFIALTILRLFQNRYE